MIISPILIIDWDGSHEKWIHYNIMIARTWSYPKLSLNLVLKSPGFVSCRVTTTSDKYGPAVSIWCKRWEETRGEVGEERRGKERREEERKRWRRSKRRKRRRISVGLVDRIGRRLWAREAGFMKCNRKKRDTGKVGRWEISQSSIIIISVCKIRY